MRALLAPGMVLESRALLLLLLLPDGRGPPAGGGRGEQRERGDEGDRRA
jgi:hypothetical protein